MDTTIIASAMAPTVPPWPDDGLEYATLPASGDDGFPQAFLLEIDGTIYRLTLAVYYRDPAFVLDATYANSVFELPDPVRGLSLNLKVEHEDQPDATRLLGARNVVRDMPIALGPLRVRFTRIRVAQANLAGPGPFGSELVAQVAVSDA
jgi:hypothetical protein